MLTEDEEPMFNEEMMEQLLKPSRIPSGYIAASTNLTGMDLDMYGNIAKSDPYVKVSTSLSLPLLSPPDPSPSLPLPFFSSLSGVNLTPPTLYPRRL